MSNPSMHASMSQAFNILIKRQEKGDGPPWNVYKRVSKAKFSDCIPYFTQAHIYIQSNKHND